MVTAATTSPTTRKTAPLERARVRLSSMSRTGSLRADFDAAQITEESKKHWALARAASANAEASPTARRELRVRARYEVANNSYAKGIIRTLSDDLVGTGPRLQMLLEDEKANRQVEAAWSEWAERVRLADQLCQMRRARAVDGESFMLLGSNPTITEGVSLWTRVIEADRVTNPHLVGETPDEVDGIRFDDYGSPSAYHVLREHPGSDIIFGASPMEGDWLSARDVIHYQRPDRPEQARGTSELTPALPLFNHLRRYTLAVVTAAEIAADISGVIYTDAPGLSDEDQAELEAMDRVELERQAWLTMPAGWKISQLKAEQPTTEYPAFKHEILNEIARCLEIPFNIAAGNSSGYNYSSGRLDHQSYFRGIRVDRRHMERHVLDRLFAVFLHEAALIEGLLPQQLRQHRKATPHTWFWDGHEHVDPVKEAQAQRERLGNNTTTLAREYALQGLDWREQLKQRAKEIELARELGLVPAAQPATAADEGEDDDGAEE